MIDVDGQESNSLFNIGQGRLGTLLESIAVPEIREQAVELASLLAERLRQEELSGVQVAASEYAPQDLLEDQEVGVA
jgi:hydroxyacylglutathione hydrolase